VPFANIASNEARAAGMNAADLVVVGPQAHQPVDVAALQRLVELDLHVVGGTGRGGRWLRSAHRALRLLSSAEL